MGHGSDFARSFNGRSRSRTAIAALALASGVVLSSAGVAGATSGNSQGQGKGTGEHKVTLCHATHSRTNPYVMITVDYDAIVKHGHGDHDGPVFSAGLAKHVAWGDIIPAFNYGGAAVYGGKNMTAQGQAILANGCNVPTPPTTVPPTTPTTAAPTTTTTGAVGGTTTTTASGSTTTTTSTPGGTTTTTVAVQGATVTRPGGGQVGNGQSPTTTGAVAGATLGATNANSGRLPVTGAATMVLATIGLLLLAAGAFVLARRRQLV